MSTSKKFFLVAVLIVVNAIYFYPKYRSLNDAEYYSDHPLIQQLADEAEKEVQTKLGQLTPTPSFTAQPSEQATANFARLYQSLRSDTLFRIKVWAPDFTVIWSDQPELIGKNFPDNEEVAEVLKTGEKKIETVLTRGGGSTKTELGTESFYSNYIEIYVPIKTIAGRVIGIVEVYRAVSDIVAKIRSDFYRTLALSLGGSVLLFAIFMAAVKSRGKELKP